MWFESPGGMAHMCWSPQRTVNKASIHHCCHCSQNGETVHTPLYAVYHTVISLHFPLLHPSEFSPRWLSVSVSLSLGMNIDRFDKPSLTWFSQLRWPNTLNMSTNLSTASINHWRLWRRTGWGQKRLCHKSFHRTTCMKIALLILVSYSATWCHSFRTEQRESGSRKWRTFELMIVGSRTVASRELCYLAGI